MKHTERWLRHQMAMEAAPPPEGDFYPVSYDFDIKAAKEATTKIDELLERTK
jgi:hypothetical protein